MNFTWTNNKELNSVSKDNITCNYRYNKDGIRYRKYLENGVVLYQLDGSVIVGEQKQNNDGTLEYDLEFCYDSNDQILSMIYNGVEYYYIKNIQGDIVGIMDAAGTQVVTYTYDSWGKCLSVSGNTEIGNRNPFRYRGYYYDGETGFYYMKSRYYDPEVGRFISPDTTAVLTATPTVLRDKNLYAYCDNNPIIRVDITGKIWETVFDVVSLGISIVEVAVNPGDPWAWAGLVGDALDLIPFVTGIGEMTKAVSKTRKVINNSDDVVDVAKSLRKTVGKKPGVYEIGYKSGKNYVGKGDLGRAITSAVSHAKKGNDVVTSIRWKQSKNVFTAFMEEYALQSFYVAQNRKMYNKIWSPGKKYYETWRKRIK